MIPSRIASEFRRMHSSQRRGMWPPLQKSAAVGCCLVTVMIARRLLPDRLRLEVAGHNHQDADTVQSQEDCSGLLCYQANHPDSVIAQIPKEVFLMCGLYRINLRYHSHSVYLIRLVTIIFYKCFNIHLIFFWLIDSLGKILLFGCTVHVSMLMHGIARSLRVLKL